MNSKNDVIDIANYIIFYANKYGYEVNNLSLQKLLYYLKAKLLYEESSFQIEETVEKWKLGPVFPKVYHEFKIFGSDMILEPLKRVEVKDEKIRLKKFNSAIFTDFEKIKMNELLEKMIEVDRFRLVDMTHEEDIWKQYEEFIESGVKNIQYTDYEIKEYFNKEETDRPWE